MRFLLAIFTLLTLSVSGQEFELMKMEFNTSSHEFAPFVLGEDLIYCSDQRSNTLKATVDVTGGLPITWRSSSGEELLLKQFSFLESFIHLGPLSFSSTSNLLAFSGVKESRFSPLAKPGIYFSVRNQDGTWSTPVPFEWNSPKGDYSCAHPSLSSDGKTLYFSSDMEGSLGQSDIFYSNLTTHGWDTPVHLGAEINTAGKELFPFLAQDGRLFFASDSLQNAQQFDVFSTQLGTNEKWVKPEKLPQPFNSKFNDYGVYFVKDGLSGYLSSDRNKGDADVYAFKFALPELRGCPEAYETSFCYLIEETEIQKTDTLPIIYEWDFGDGTKAEGMSHEHCYPGFGSYDLSFNIYDTLTEIQFAKVSQIHIDIEPARIPLFEVPNAISVKEALHLEVNDHELDGFEVDQYFWQIQGQSSILGDTAHIEFDAEGTYEIAVGAIGKSVNGRRQVRCGSRMITVGNDELKVANEMKMDRMQSIRPSSLAYELKEPELELIYFVKFHESNRQVPFNDPYFSNIEGEITERFIFSDSMFHYSVGKTNDLLSLHALQRELLENGYHEAVVLDVSTNEYQEEVIQKGSYYSDEEKEVMNSFVQSLENIQFEVNSSKISAASKENLDQIVDILIIDEGLRLQISAHTDNQGANDFNQKLSEDRANEVVNYLISKQISRDRLQAKGYGATRPIANNMNEAGRSQNRRVEFTLLFEE